MKIAATIESWDFEHPFRIARGEMTALDVVTVEVTARDGTVGRAEAAGVDYAGETPAGIVADLQTFAHTAPDDLTSAALLSMMPAGGARNALDCALWDLEAKRSGVPAWRTAGLTSTEAVVSACTIGIGSDAETRAKARALRDWPLIKIKVGADQLLEPLTIIAEEVPDAKFIVDANQSWTIDKLNALAPEMAARKVILVEQPLPVERDNELTAYTGSIAIAADESCVDRRSLPGLIGRYHAVNIKLDKTGGLTEALHLAREARHLGFRIMVGCMAGTSLAMAPAALIAQTADFVDLDGPLLHRNDRAHAIQYNQGFMSFPTAALWG